MEDPERKVGECFCAGGISAAADRCGGSEEFRGACGEFECAEAAHGESGDVDTAGVDAVVVSELSEEFGDEVERIGPPASIGALWSGDEAGVLFAMLGFGEFAGGVSELSGVICATFAGPVQEEHEGELGVLCAIVVFRNEESVVKFCGFGFRGFEGFGLVEGVDVWGLGFIGRECG
ncbi:MAG: hypothetical protein RL215_700 [Planctomycetota bacterium]